MPRVHFVKKAQKDNSAVKAGESYYWWKFRYGGKHCSRTRPRQSQLTQSDKLGRIYGAQETIEDLSLPTATDFDRKEDCASAVTDLKDTWDDVISELREVGDEYEESASNMEEYFQGSSQVDEIREKGEAVTNSADEAENEAEAFEEAANEIESLENTSYRVTFSCTNEGCGAEGHEDFDDADDDIDECPECSSDVETETEERENTSWQDDAQNLIDNLPTTLEVEMY